MPKLRHPWTDRKNTSFFKPSRSIEEQQSGESVETVQTEQELIGKLPLLTGVGYASGNEEDDNKLHQDVYVSNSETEDVQNTRLFQTQSSDLVYPSQAVHSHTTQTATEEPVTHYRSSFSRPLLSSSHSTEREERKKNIITPAPRSRAFRPQLRRAISEANCRFRGIKDSVQKPEVHKPKPSKNTKPIWTDPYIHAFRTFDSSILEMPIDLLEETTEPVITYDRPNFVPNKSEVQRPTHANEFPLNEIIQSHFRQNPGILQTQSQMEMDRPKHGRNNLIRRMHSTAVDTGSSYLARFRKPGCTSTWTSRDPVDHVSRQVTFNESRVSSESGLKRNASCDNLVHRPQQAPTPIVLVNNMDLSNSPPPPFSAIRLNRHDSDPTHIYDPNDPSLVTTFDKSTDTGGTQVLSSQSNYSMAAYAADGNFVEHGADHAKQSTSSYLKEQFLAFFQPSDNKLAMKLFGSKNALMKEKRRQAQQGKWVIHPCSSFRFYWDLLMLVLLIANLIILPVAISFFSDDLSIHWIVFNTISDVIFVADIAVKFRTGIVTNDYADEIILNPREIARQYVKTWFVLDFISSIPMDYIYLIFNKKDQYNQFFSAGRTLRILRLAKLLSMLRLLRLTRLVRYVSQWEEFLNIASKFMGIFNLVLLMLLLGHWNACLQYLIPMLMEFPPDSWVKRCKLENADWFQQYTWALFKAMSHMLSIGYGRFPPISIGDAWITIVSMMSGATCYALFVGHAAALIQSFDTSKRLYREKFKQVEEYMAYRKLPRALRQRIANYYEHRYQGKMFDEAQILNELSECLREQVINYNCRALVAAVPFFTYADQDFVSEVVTKLKFEVFQPGDLIIKEGTIGNKMYFIQEGIVDIITKDGEVATSLSDGSYFGEICLLANARRVASVKVVVYSNLYSLDRESFLSVLENYPLMRRTMESVAAERLSNIGQNPAMVSNRENLKEDLSLVKEIVSSAVTPVVSSTEHESENEDSQSHLIFKQLLKKRKQKRFSRLPRSNGSGTRQSQDLPLDTEDSSDTSKPPSDGNKQRITIPNVNAVGRFFKGVTQRHRSTHGLSVDSSDARKKSPLVCDQMRRSQSNKLDADAKVDAEPSNDADTLEGNQDDSEKTLLDQNSLK